MPRRQASGVIAVRTTVAGAVLALTVAACGASDGPSTAGSLPTAGSATVAATAPATTEASTVPASAASTEPDATSAPPDAPPATDAPTTTAPAIGTSLAEWVDRQEAEGRTQGYTIAGEGTDAKVLIAYPPGDYVHVAGGLLLATGSVVDLPDGVSTTRAPMVAGLAGRPVLISPLADRHAMWVLDPEFGTWTPGPDLGVFADNQSVAYLGVLDGRLVLADQTVRDDGTGMYLPDRFGGVIVDPDLTATPMAAPPDGQFLRITSAVGPHALMLGLDSAADVNAPLTQPWDFDVRTNTWTAVAQPDWLGCVPECNWSAPHEGPDVHLEVVVDDTVVMALPDGSIGRYVPDTGAWTQLDDAPLELAGPAVAVLGDQIAIAPMVTGYSPDRPGTVAVLDLTAGVWTTDTIDVGELPEGYAMTEARTDGTVGLFDVIHPAEMSEPSSPDVAYDPVTRTWRPPTADEVALWSVLPGIGGGTGSLRDLLV